MENYIGFLLRQARISKNYSQEGICKGICAPSYLCKIEQGKTTASEEILIKLFEVLDIRYCTDEGLIRKAKQVFKQFCSLLEVEGELQACSSFFDCHASELEVSEMHLEYHLYLFYEQIIHKQSKVEAEYSYLEKMLSYMDDTLKALYFYLCSLYFESHEKSVESMEKAVLISKKSFYKYVLAALQFNGGKYEQCMMNAESAYHLAVEDGNPFVLISASFLLGSCHCFYHNLQAAEQYYQRAVSLSRGYRHDVSAHALYNLATAYMEIGEYEHSLSLFEQIHTFEKNTEEYVRYCQKLIVLYVQMSEFSKAAEKLKEMEIVCDGLEDSKGIYRWMIDFLRRMVSGSYLDDEKYGEVLGELYRKAEMVFGYGMKYFYGMRLIELLKHQRRYKEALKISEELKLS